jgi:hypothetical protein
MVLESHDFELRFRNGMRVGPVGRAKREPSPNILTIVAVESKQLVSARAQLIPAECHPPHPRINARL